MRKIICVILALFLASSAAFAGYQIFREYTERQESADTYTDLENLISFPEVLPEEEPDETNLSESGETEPAPVGPTIDFAGLEEINEDCVAWIYIEDTAINYPVVQGSDNSYYLKHLIDGKWNSAGCIFLDSRVDSDISDRHSIIYGHHMKDGTMFSGLTKYKKQDYYEAHPAGLLITPEQTYRIEFFAGYVVSVEDSAWKIGFESDEEFETWIKEAKQRSWFESPLSPAVTDRILSLSTCSYEFDNARFVLHAILVEVNENIKAIRKSKGLSQEELAIKLNVVRQTISKWEKGLSVPDSDMLIALSEVLETPVSTLLGETIDEPKPDDLKVISEKLEVINLQLAKRKTTRRKIFHWSFISLCAFIVIIFAVLFVLNSPYLGWDYSKPETAVIGVGFHALEWLFVRVSPIVLIGAIVGAVLTREKR